MARRSIALQGRDGDPAGRQDQVHGGDRGRRGLSRGRGARRAQPLDLAVARRAPGQGGDGRGAQAAVQNLRRRGRGARLRMGGRLGAPLQGHRDRISQVRLARDRAAEQSRYRARLHRQRGARRVRDPSGQPPDLGRALSGDLAQRAQAARALHSQRTQQQILRDHDRRRFGLVAPRGRYLSGRRRRARPRYRRAARGLRRRRGLGPGIRVALRGRGHQLAEL